MTLLISPQTQSLHPSKKIAVQLFFSESSLDSMQIPPKNSWIDKNIAVQLFFVLIQVKKYLYSYLFNGIHFKILGFELVKMNPSWIQNTSNPAIVLPVQLCCQNSWIKPSNLFTWIRFE